MYAWILTIKTSLPNTCETHAALRYDCRGFDSFAKAKATLREQLKTLAFSRNAMFDGQGHILRLEEYIERCKHEDTTEEYWDFMDNGWLTAGRLKALRDGLAAIFAGEDVDVPVEDGDYEDALLAMEVTDDSVRLIGWDDGPCNGYLPLVATNMFNMAKEGEYHLYLDDLFGQDDCSAELYMDLKKVEIQ